MAWPIRLLTCLERTVSDLIGSCYKKTIAVLILLHFQPFRYSSLRRPCMAHCHGCQRRRRSDRHKGSALEVWRKSDCRSRYFTVTIFLKQQLTIKNACWFASSKPAGNHSTGTPQPAFLLLQIRTVSQTFLHPLTN